MARAYKRDAKGRFASSGGGGGKKSGGKKAKGGPGKWAKTAADVSGGAAASKKKNAAAHQSLADKGVSAVGSRLKSKTEGRFTGRAKTKRANAEMWVSTARKNAPSRPSGSTIKRR